MSQTHTASVRCPFCNLVNFASAERCVRCKNPMQNAPQGHTVNINIALPPAQVLGPAVQPQINVNGVPAAPDIPQQTAPYSSQQVPAPAANQSDAYQLQNQLGFNQWRQQNVATPIPAPNAFNPFPYPPAPASGGVFRKGSRLVVHERVGLPPHCIQCDAEVSPYTGGAFIRQKFRWHHPAVYAAVISPLIYVILAAALSKHATQDIPLCGEHMASRKQMRNILIGIGLFSTFAIFVLGAGGSFGWAFLLFLATIIGIPLWCEYMYKPVRVDKIENDYVYLRGADHKFLDRLPPC